MVIQGNKQKQAPRISGRKKLMPKGKLLFLSELFLTQLSLKKIFFKIPNKFYILKKNKIIPNNFQVPGWFSTWYLQSAPYYFRIFQEQIILLHNDKPLKSKDFSFFLYTINRIVWNTFISFYLAYFWLQPKEVS